MKRALMVIGLGALLLGACGGDDGGGGGALGDVPELSGDEKVLADGVASGFSEDTPDATDAQAACVGARIVKEFGAKRVREIDFSQDDLVLDESDARKAAKAVMACIDMREVFVTGMTEGSEISQKSADCLAKKISDDDLEEMLVATFQGGEDDAITGTIMGNVMKAMADCLSPDELAELTG